MLLFTIIFIIGNFFLSELVSCTVYGRFLPKTEQDNVENFLKNCKQIQGVKMMILIEDSVESWNYIGTNFSFLTKYHYGDISINLYYSIPRWSKTHRQIKQKIKELQQIS